MTDPLKEQLLGHLLGALDEPEQRQIEARLKDDPQLRRQSALLRGRLRELEAARCAFDPPPGLAERTCRMVVVEADRSTGTGRGGRPGMTPDTAPSGWVGGVRWADVAVAAGVLLAAIVLIIPAIHNSHVKITDVAVCQNNLRQLGMALTQYSDRHDDYFPVVPARGNLAAAGIYAPILRSEGFLGEVRWTICPGSPAAGQQRYRVPPLDEIRAASGKELARLHKAMGGSYAYSFGHFSGGVYHGTKNLRRLSFVIMADAPGSMPGLQSIHHRGRGQNVLFECLRVKFVRSSKPNDRADDFYVNDEGVVGAGMRRDDSVVGASAAPPLRYVH